MEKTGSLTTIVTGWVRLMICHSWQSGISIVTRCSQRKTLSMIVFKMVNFKVNWSPKFPPDNASAYLLLHAGVRWVTSLPIGDCDCPPLLWSHKMITSKSEKPSLVLYLGVPETHILEASIPNMIAITICKHLFFAPVRCNLLQKKKRKWTVANVANSSEKVVDEHNFF